MRARASKSSSLERDLAGRPLVLAALLFGLGVWIGPLSPQAPGVALVVALSLSTMALAGSRRAPILSFALVSLASALWGVGLSQRQAAIELPADLAAEEVVEGRVVAVSPPRENRTRVHLRVHRVIRGEAFFDARFGVWLSLDGAPSLYVGDSVRARVRLRKPRGPTNPGQRDRRGEDQAQGIAFLARPVRGQWSAIGFPPPPARFQRDYRERFAELCARAIDEGNAARLVRTLGLGDRAALPEETLSDFRDTGLAHLLSVSGLHVGVVALGLCRLLRWLLTRFSALTLRCDVPRLAALLTVPMCWLYVFLSGAEVPAVRSGVMVSALFLARVLGRDDDAPSALCLAALVILARDPAALRSISFQLSFVAVASLMLGTRPLNEWLSRRLSLDESDERSRLLRCARWLCATLAATAIASLATAPLVARAFGQTSIVAVLANLVALPLGSALTVLSACAALAMSLCEPIAALLLCLCDPLAALLLEITRLFASLPWASLDVSPPTGAVVAAAYACLLALWLWPRSRRAGMLSACIGALGLVVFAGLPWMARHMDRSLRVTFFDIGQGDAALVRFPDGQTMLIDGGGDPEGRWRVGERVLVPALRALGVERLDIAMLSHPHPDHANGLIESAAALRPREIWIARGQTQVPGGLSRALVDAAPKAQIVELAAGDRRELSGVEVAILHPPPNAPHLGENDASLSARLSLGEISFLFTGDIEALGEQALLSAGRDLRATVLKAPHHGSRTSSTPEFVAATSPGHVVFSCGRDNRFGFPHAEIVARYESRGSAIHRTDRDGAITFVTDGQSLNVLKSFVAEQ